MPTHAKTYVKVSNPLYDSKIQELGDKIVILFDHFYTFSSIPFKNLYIHVKNLKNPELNLTIRATLISLKPMRKL